MVVSPLKRVDCYPPSLLVLSHNIEINITKRNRLFQSSLTKRFSPTSNSSAVTNASSTTSQPSDTTLINDESDSSNTSCTVPLKDQPSVISSVEVTMSWADSSHVLLPFKTFFPKWENISIFYRDYHILSLLKTMQHVGWPVCRYVQNVFGLVHEATKRYKPSVSSAAFHRHSESHQNKKEVDNSLPIVVPSELKSELVAAAALVVVLDTLPLNFAYQREVFMGLARVLIEILQCYSAVSSIDMKLLLPSYTSVCERVLKLAEDYRKLFRSDLDDFLSIGGSVSSDGVTLEDTGKNYYDFVVHYVQVQLRAASRGGGRIGSLRTKLMFITSHEGRETAGYIRNTINMELKETTGRDLPDFERNFSFVTDCAAKMPFVLGASVSPSSVPYFHRWVGCISHQINTAMKHPMASQIVQHGRIGQDLERVKKYVTLFKNVSLNV